MKKYDLELTVEILPDGGFVCRCANNKKEKFYHEAFSDRAAMLQHLSDWLDANVDE